MKNLTEKSLKNKVRLNSDTIQYLKILGESFESIENLCFINNHKHMDKEFRSLSRSLTKYYAQRKLNEGAFNYLFSMLLENYITCKTGNIIQNQLAKSF